MHFPIFEIANVLRTIYKFQFSFSLNTIFPFFFPFNFAFIDISTLKLYFSYKELNILLIISFFFSFNDLINNDLKFLIFAGKLYFAFN